MPQVSVISTVLNGAPYFDRIVTAVLGQTSCDFEWVIVDDGSEDATPQLLTELAVRDARVRVLSPGRIGRAPALNAAVAAASAPLIANQDFDDASEPDRLVRQRDFLDSHPKVGLLGAWYVLVDHRRGERYLRMPPPDHDLMVRALAKNVPFAHTMVMFRRSAWEAAGGYPLVPDFEDFLLAVAMVERGWKIANLPDVLGEHVVHERSYWHRRYRYRERQRRLARVQLQAIRRLGLPPWMLVYPLGRSVYWCIPDALKRAVRRNLGGSRERDLVRLV
jgi:glycosyltransferase involved in cell wall biosynthesis